MPWDGEIVIVDSSDASVARAAEVLAAGGLVAVPTETVYGLAADAANPEAVRKIFAVKGRPSDHPLIVHLGRGSRLSSWAAEIPDAAYRLTEALWPGPLTVILPKDPSVLPETTGGLETVALRMPSHPVAQRLLARFEGGLAAPSANRFGRVSPTTAIDVEADLGASVDLIIDGGACAVGVESTIVAWVDGEATILRPGGIAPDEISDIIGGVVTVSSKSTVRAPGTLASHYAPSTPIELSTDEMLVSRASQLSRSGLRVGIVSISAVDASGATAAWDAGGDVNVFAHELYRILRLADASGLDVLLAVPPPEAGLGVAVADRLRRAASSSKAP